MKHELHELERITRISEALNDMNMDPKEAYNIWAEQYDTNENKTRDLEAVALREMLRACSFEHCLELGCGTGKNTSWLLTIAKQITAVDFSEEMLEKAKKKIDATRVKFLQADITKKLNFPSNQFDLVTFSLVLEHMKDLNEIFQQLPGMLRDGGLVYIGELHPFKQYSGSKARFETKEGLQIVDCFNHHVSDFVGAAKKNGLNMVQLEEYFDDDDRNGIPRVLAMLFKKVAG